MRRVDLHDRHAARPQRVHEGGESRPCPRPRSGRTRSRRRRPDRCPPSGQALWTVSRSAPTDTMPPRSRNASINCARSGHQPYRVRQRADTGRHRRRELSDAVSDHCVRGRFPSGARARSGRPAREKRAGWAYSVRCGPRVIVSEENVGQGNVGGREQREALLECVLEGRLATVDRFAHPRVLGTLSGEEKHERLARPPGADLPGGAPRNRSSVARSSARSRPTVEKRWPKW